MIYIKIAARRPCYGGVIFGAHFEACNARCGEFVSGVRREQRTAA
jgi:hypothetical protein